MMSATSPRDVIPTSRMPVIVGLAALLLLVVGLGTWATQTVIEGAVVAAGQVIVESNRQAVQHPDGGVVAEVLVREGSAVQRGDVLVRLDPTMALSELEIVESQLFELMARRGRLEAERDGATAITFDPALLASAASSSEVADLVRGQELLFDARLESFNQSVTQLQNQKLQLNNQVGGIDAVSTALQAQITLTQQELDGQERLLEKGLAQGSRVLNLRREVARLSGAIGEATAQKAEALQRIAEIEIEIARLSGQRREEAITTLRDLKISEIELSERSKTIRTRLDRMEIRAPSAGIVYDTACWESGRSSAGRSDPLHPARRPASPHRGTGEPAQHFCGTCGARRRRSLPLFRHARNARSSCPRPPGFTGRPVRPESGASYYRVEVELPKSELEKLAAGQVVIPGMPAQTFLQTGEYTPLAYLLKPLQDT